MNTINQKRYIGQSINIKSRWNKHISELNNNSHCNDYLQKSWNKYGIEVFNFYVLEYCNKDELNDKERYYIDYYNTTDRKLGYNLKSGGQDYCYYTEEIKDKISQSNKKYYKNSQGREIQRQNALKQWSNLEIKSKIMGENNGMFGKTHSVETRQKISQSRLGNPIKKRYSQQVHCIELDAIYDNSVEAGKLLSLDSTSILKVCRGERKHVVDIIGNLLIIGNNIC